MRTLRTERTEPNALNVALGLGIVTGAVAVGLIANLAAPEPAPTCREDEAAIATLPGQDFTGGMASTHCVPIDDLIERWNR